MGHFGAVDTRNTRSAQPPRNIAINTCPHSIHMHEHDRECPFPSLCLKNAQPTSQIRRVLEQNVFTFFVGAKTD